MTFLVELNQISLYMLYCAEACNELISASLRPGNTAFFVVAAVASRRQPARVLNLQPPAAKTNALLLGQYCINIVPKTICSIFPADCAPPLNVTLIILVVILTLVYMVTLD